MEIARRTLFEGKSLRLGHVIARPTSSACGELECKSTNMLVLPLTGVFAKHDGPRRHVIATPAHAVFIAAGSPYRISFPQSIGDQCLTVSFSGAAFPQVLPQGASGNGLDASAFAGHVLLPPAVMLARSLLWQRCARGESDPLELEELGMSLLHCALHLACKEGHGRKRGARSGPARRLRQLESVKEAIALHPERSWTLGELADLACVSPSHLAHIFRQEVGTPVYRYVLRSRLGMALDAVLDSDLDLTRIALETGFASHSHFTARFRALFGLTPTELRHRASAATAAELRKIVTADATGALYACGTQST